MPFWISLIGLNAVLLIFNIFNKNVALACCSFAGLAASISGLIDTIGG